MTPEQRMRIAEAAAQLGSKMRGGFLEHTVSVTQDRYDDVTPSVSAFTLPEPKARPETNRRKFKRNKRRGL